MRVSYSTKQQLSARSVGSCGQVKLQNDPRQHASVMLKSCKSRSTLPLKCYTTSEMMYQYRISDQMLHQSKRQIQLTRRFTSESITPRSCAVKEGASLAEYNGSKVAEDVRYADCEKGLDYVL